MSHFNELLPAFKTEWANARHPALPIERCTLEHDGTKFWWIQAPDGIDIINWECRPFPGCASLIVTTKVVLKENLRGRGLGRFFRELRHKAYARAGFQGEIATVRTDNPAQNRLMQTMGATKMGEFPSDFGGSYALWLTKLAPVANVQPVTTQPNPGPAWNPPRITIPARVEPPANPTTLGGDIWVGRTQPTAEAVQHVAGSGGKKKKKKFSHWGG